MEKKVFTRKAFSAGLLALLAPGLAVAGDWSGYVGGEVRYFQERGDFGQPQNQYSVVLEPEYYHEWNDGDASFTFTPFVRGDTLDSERSHGDIRELNWALRGDDWDFKAGISKVFWGVAETQHLVDIINQTDLVENLDQEDKLGQPMVNLTLIRDWGSLNFFVLPWFRERTFPGEDGRLRFALPVDTEHPIYDDPDEEHHLDFAVRWSQVIGAFDIGVAHFTGTSREPLFVPTPTPNGLVLRPRYTTIDQTSIDLQATLGAWLWKLEAYSRGGFGDDRYVAAVGGFEYTLFGVTDNGGDLGLLLEYQYDERDHSSGFPVLDSWFVGTRLTLNDVESTEILLAYGVNEENGKTFNLEASRRLSDNWKLLVEARAFSGVDDDEFFVNPWFSFRNDDYVQVTLEKYF